MWVVPLLFAVGWGQEVTWTVPTPKPTITPAPRSACAYQTTDRGPFALDCLQELFLTAGCSIRGESYPTDTQKDGDADPTQGKLDKDEYNNNDNTWQDVQDLMGDLKTAADSAGATDDASLDCFGAQTDPPTPDPTLHPVSRQPSPSPTRTPTTFTPAPTYADDSVWVSLYTVASATDDIQAACQSMGYDRQYDETRYVLKMCASGDCDYVIAETGEICDLFDSAEGLTALYGVNADGPFRELADGETRANGAAYVSSTTVGATIEISSLRNFSSCREIGTPFDDGFTVDMSATPCSGRGAGNAYMSNTACSGDAADALLISVYIANGLFDSCDDEFLYDLTADSTSSAFKWSGTCWGSDASGSSDYANSVRDMLCVQRCDDLTTWRYDGEDACFKATASAAGADGSCTGSVRNSAENAKATSVCAGAAGDTEDGCYLRNTAADSWHTTDAAWSDAEQVDYVNFVAYGSAGWSDTTQQLSLNKDTGLWSYNDDTAAQTTICRADANVNSAKGEEAATQCLADGNDDGDDFEASSASSSYPTLFVARSGFTTDTAGELHIVVHVPATLYDLNMRFENSTNDIAEYQNDADASAMKWTGAQLDTGCRSAADPADVCDSGELAADACNADASCAYYADACAAPFEYELSVPWTTFNLGGAGGVQRLESYRDDNNDEYTTQTDEADDGQNHMYLFGSTIKISAKQPLFIDQDLATDADTSGTQFRREYWHRSITVRLPMIVKFQKTIHVSTSLNVVSTKFNYKTVAAIIESIQYDTKFFEPPYAKIKLQIRTKSQYPYMLNANVDQAVLSVGGEETSDTTPVGLVLEHLGTDQNCTFTNPDHMREGDICVQEWLLRITPQSNVCYATGEYTIDYEASCFHGKEVCYMPLDGDNNEITRIAFTFKLQTSKFCPTVVHEVPIAGTLTLTGRESFKPDEESMEGATAGNNYLQGEVVKFLGVTSSEMAVITATEVVEIQVRQSLEDLVQTGYRAVYYDQSSQDMVLYSKGSSTTGTVGITIGETTTQVELLDPTTDLFKTGDDIDEAGTMQFSATEAGFQLLLHAKVFPVNVDSFGSKTIVATMEVQYEGLPDANNRRRRRLLTASADELQAKATVGVQAWTPGQLPLGLTTSASMAMTLSLYNSDVTRRTARQFAQSIKGAMLNGFMSDPALKGKKVYDEQVSVDVVYSEGVPIWKRPQYQGVGGADRRRLGGSSQTLRVDFTFASSTKPNSVDLHKMMEIFEKQIVMPASPLMTQEIFFGAVLHELKEIETSNYEVREDSRPLRADGGEFDAGLESAAGLAVPCLALLAALLALVQ